jgi:3-phenylpropionate/trans-cinnamate dioxygenase ferredoxin reductase subunit
VPDRTVIIGAGQAGVQLAVSLRQGGYAGEVVLVGKEPHVPYQRPPLSKQVLKREWAAERCQLRHLEFYRQHDIDLLLGRAATAVDTLAGQVRLDDGTSWNYTTLAICSGSRLNRLEVSGADLPGVCYLRTVDDALALSAALGPDLDLVVIGGGYIGLEVAATARLLGCRVSVVEALERLLQRSALPEIAGFLQQRHQAEGVRFHLNRKVSRLRGAQRVEGVELDNGAVIPADLVMVGVGVRPDLRWLQDAGIETNRGIRVDPHCRTNISNVYAAGDVTEVCHPLFDGWQVLESVQNAVSQGKIAAANILGREDSYDEVPWFWSEQYDCRLQMAGIPRPGDARVRRDNPETGGFSVFTLAQDKLSAVQSINSPRDYMLGRQLIGHRASVTTEALQDHHHNLKDLL